MDYDALATQNGGQAATATATPPASGAPDKYDSIASQYGGQSDQPAPQGPGFIQSVVQSVASPVLRAYSSAKDIYNEASQIPSLIPGAIKDAVSLAKSTPEQRSQFYSTVKTQLGATPEKSNPDDYNYGYFGKQTPIGNNQFNIFQGLTPNNEAAMKDAVGTGAQAAAMYAVPGGPGADVFSQGLKAGVMPFLKSSVATGATGLGLYGMGQSLQNNDSMLDVAKNTAESTVLGGATGPLAGLIPFAPGLIKKGIQTFAGDTADQLINSLIKPLMKNFAYSKDPARGILAEGLQGNSIEELGQNVQSRLQSVGQQIGKTGDQLTDIGRSTGKTMDLTPALSPLNEAMDNAAKAGNQTLLDSLQSVKTALQHDLGRVSDGEGNNIIISKGQKNLEDANYSDAVNFLNDVKTHTRFTGRESDDKALNAATQKVYGGARQIMNDYAAGVDPEAGAFLKNLNARYGDLQSADLAIQHRALAMAKNNYFNMAEHFGQLAGGTVALTHLLSGDLPGFAQWAGATAIEMMGSKAARSVKVQTTLAQFLNSISGAQRKAILEQSPELMKWYQQSHQLKQLPAPKPGAPKFQNAVPINLAPKTQSTKDAEMVAKLGKKYEKQAPLALPPGTKATGPTINLPSRSLSTLQNNEMKNVQAGLRENPRSSTLGVKSFDTKFNTRDLSELSKQ